MSRKGHIYSTGSKSRQTIFYMTSAFNIFVRQSLREGGIPFEIKTDRRTNMETTAAMLEAERIAKDPSAKGYTDLDALFADLKK